jgi:hypothetical protein
MLQVKALAEFGDLPENVDLIVLQQLPHLDELNFIVVWMLMMVVVVVVMMMMMTMIKMMMI